MAASPPSAYVVGAYEHPIRRATHHTLASLHADVALGALGDAGLRAADVDGFFCAADAPGLGVFAMCEHLGIQPRYVESTETGGSSYIVHLKHAVQAISSGKCDVALIVMADNQLAAGRGFGLTGVANAMDMPAINFEFPYIQSPVGGYALAAQRHMHDWGTTAEQLAWVKVAFSHHAQHNPHALLRDPVTVAEVLASPLIADPLHRLDCCVMTDGGGAIVVARPEIARSLTRPLVPVLGTGEGMKYNLGGRVDLSYSAGVHSAPAAFAEAGVTPADIRYASLYDSFTITVIMQLEDIGFCAKGEGGRFVDDGKLIAGVGRLPVNTDGGGLCNNHPGNRGGMTKLLEAIRQARGEAHPAVQVPDPALVLAHGTGGSLWGTHVAATAIFGRE
ncbi:acetyl-CoA C-acetyltransferase [Novosphingobium sp. 1529]|uniref:thiolase domain-containing protein n=1 Tax=Novosphingobium sp. 1529 TaxID=3156424 RepID=UPI001494A87D